MMLHNFDMSSWYDHVLYNLSLALFVMMSNMSECFKDRNKIQQNSFNLTSDNPEILIIWYLRIIVPRCL